MREEEAPQPKKAVRGFLTASLIFMNTLGHAAISCQILGLEIEESGFSLMQRPGNQSPQGWDCQSFN